MIDVMKQTMKHEGAERIMRHKSWAAPPGDGDAPRRARSLSRAQRRRFLIKKRRS
jgi:hypothetical protein